MWDIENYVDLIDSTTIFLKLTNMTINEFKDILSKWNEKGWSGVYLNAMSDEDLWILKEYDQDKVLLEINTTEFDRFVFIVNCLNWLRQATYEEAMNEILK